MILNVDQFIGDERFVGRTLEELLYPAEVNAERTKYPDPDSLSIAEEIPSLPWGWEV